MPRIRQKTRKLHELYKILYSSIEKKELISGLCSEISELLEVGIIVIDEYYNLMNNFASERPTANWLWNIFGGKNTKFLKDSQYNTRSSFWWSNVEYNGDFKISTQLRKDFIKHMIKKTAYRIFN